MFGWTYSVTSITEARGAGSRHRPSPGAPLDTSETLPSLAQKVAALKDLDWRWVEILIGIPFEHVELGRMPASEVWARACAPWRSWLR